MALVLWTAHPDGATRQSWARALRERGHLAHAVDPDAPPERPRVLDGVCVAASLPAALVQQLRDRAGAGVPVQLLEEGVDFDGDWLVELERTRSAPLELGDLRIDLRRGLAQRGEAFHQLTDIEAVLLAWMANRAGLVQSRGDLLEGVWGYTATMQTRVVDVTIARLRAKLERDPSEPEHLITVRGKGYRLDGARPPAARGPETPPDPRFWGRQQAWELVQRWLAGGERLVTLLGPPGIGKTRFARVLHDHCRGSVWCSLQAASTPSEALQALVTALQLDASADAGTVATAITTGTRPLLVIDNAEQHVGLVKRLLASEPARPVLVTSRVRLAIAHERCLDLEPLDDAAARTLFLERARALRADFHIDRDALDQVVACSEGLPLALELAAAQVRWLGPGDLVRGLRAGALDDPGQAPGHRSYEEALVSSWNLLPEPEREALRWLAHLPGEVPVAAVQELVPEATAVLRGLTDASLVQIDTSSSPATVRLLEVIRSFVQHHHPLSIEEQRVQAEGLATYAEAWVEAVDGGRGWEALQALSALSKTLQGCAERAARAGDTPLAQRLAMGCAPLVAVYGPTNRDRELFATVGERVDVSTQRASIELQFGELDRATREVARALELANDERDRVRVKLVEIVIDFRRGELGTASLETALQHVDGVDRARVHIALAVLMRFRGDYDDGLAHIDAALAIADRRRIDWLAAEALAQRAIFLLHQGRYERAVEVLESVSATYLAHGVHQRVAILQRPLAEALMSSGNPLGACEVLRKSIQEAESRGQVLTLASLQVGLTDALLEAGEPAPALRAVETAIRLNARHAVQLASTAALLLQAEAHLALGEVDVARRLLREPLASERPFNRAIATELAVLCALAEADLDEAAALAVNPDCPPIVAALVDQLRGREVQPVPLDPGAKDTHRAYAVLCGMPGEPRTPRGRAVLAAVRGERSLYAEVQAILPVARPGALL